MSFKRSRKNEDDDEDDSKSNKKHLKVDPDLDGSDESEEEEEEEETPCIICGNEETTSKNSIILCDGEFNGKKCDIPVHLSNRSTDSECYGVEQVPPDDEKWLCQRCEAHADIDNTATICCPLKTGAFMKTTFKDKFIHVPCAWWNSSVENTKNGFTVEKWLLNKETCYICSKSQGLTIKCKHPGCKKWFHVMCAVGNETIELCKQKDIKNNVMCIDHVRPASGKSSNHSKKAKKEADPNFESSTDSSSEEEGKSEPETFRNISKSQPTDTAKKVFKAPSPAVNSNSGESKSSALMWLMEKVGTLKETIVALENIPQEYKRQMTNSKILPPPPKDSKSFPLDSLLDSAFDGRANLLEEKNQEIQALKQQLAARPSLETFQRMQEELVALRNSSISNTNHINSNGSVKESNYKADMDNVLAIFSYLKLPNLPPPVDSNLSSFLVALRGILERTQSIQSTPNHAHGNDAVTPTSTQYVVTKN